MRILLVGTPRSGTTWTHDVLTRAAHTRGVAEPDGPMSDILGAVIRRRLGMYPALRPTDPARWYPMVWDLAFAGGWPWDRSPSARSAGRGVRRLPPQLRDHGVALLARGVTRVRTRPRHVVVKSVHCPLALEWITERYTPTVVVVRRDPLNVVSSWLSLRWDRTHDLAADRPVVRDDHLRPLGLRAPGASASPETRVAWMVGVLTTALKTASERHPEWIVISHDEVCAEPRTRFAALYARLGLEWTPATDAYLAASDTPGFVVDSGGPVLHPHALTAEPVGVRRERQSSQYLRRLSPAQISEVTAVLADFPLDGWREPVVPDDARAVPCR